MSLFGRNIIDRVKRKICRYVKLPVPPYENPNYWEGVYKKLEPEDLFEWGRFEAADLVNHNYRIVAQSNYDADAAKLQQQIGQQSSPSPPITTTLTEALGVRIGNSSSSLSPSLTNSRNSRKEDEPILIVGCGNSNFGQDLLHLGILGPVVQVDVASRAIESLSQRCREAQRTGDMVLLQDDASQLSAVENDSFAAAVDKGLVDAIFCTDDYQQVFDICKSMHRVLKPGGVFSVFTFSNPEFLLRKMLFPPDPHLAPRREQQLLKRWSEVQIRQLDSIYMYRLTKATPTTVRPKRRQ